MHSANESNNPAELLQHEAPNDLPPGEHSPEKHPGNPPGEHPGNPPGEHPPGGDPPGRIVKPKTPFGDGELSELPPPCNEVTISTAVDNNLMWAWWECFPKRWEWESKQTRIFYPTFKHIIRNVPDGKILIWKGTITPWAKTIDAAAAVIELLDNANPVKIFGGRIEPPNECPQSGKRPRYLTPEVLLEKYKIEVIHFSPPAHPVARVLHPIISPGCQHRYKDGSICPLTPQRNEWSWDKDSFVDFLDAVSEWLLKYSVWQHSGRWIGPFTPHDNDSLKNIRAQDQCPCRSGRPYAECCEKKQKYLC